MSPFVVVRLAWLLSLLVSGSRAQVLSYSLDEEESVGYLVGNLKQDSGVTSRYSPSVLDTVKFGLLPGQHSDDFRVDPESGLLFVNRRLDRDSIDGCESSCLLSVEAAIVMPEFSVLHLEITLNDINDNSPTFSNDRFELTVSESSSVGTRLMLPTAADPDSGNNAIRSYRLPMPHPIFDLEYSLESGLYLVLREKLDHETQSLYRLQVLAFDDGTPRRSGILTVEVQVVDANDNSPVFDRSQYNVTIRESHPLFQGFVTVRATDQDHGLNGQVLYSFSQQTRDQYGNTFGLHNRTGAVYLKEPLDYRQGSKHQLVVVAQDRGADLQQAHTTVTVHVLDVNNHVPQITVSGVVSGSDIGLDENSPSGTIIAVISVQDMDPGVNGRCTCEILDGNFELEELYTNGYKIMSTRSFDREERSVYDSVIRCTDLGTPALSSETNVVINIRDINDQAPEFDFSAYQVSVQENATVGTSLLTVHASDLDQPGSDNSHIVYSLEEPAKSYIDIDPKTGLITLNSPLDHEQTPVLEVNIMAQDRGSPVMATQASLRIDVEDINDEPPRFIQQAYNFGTYENQANLTEIGTVSAEDRDSAPYDTFVYSLYGNSEVLEKFTIGSATGRISTRKTLDREEQSVYSMVVIVSNVLPPQHSSSVSVTVYVADKNDNAPVISFPNDQNNSVELSVFSPPEFLFTRVVASDRDLGTNAKLTYSLLDDFDVFTIDPMLGHLYVKAPLNSLTDATLDLQVVVRDNGTPSLATSASLQVVLNRTMVFARDLNILPGESTSTLTFHERILVILGAVTAVLVSLLVLAIVLVKRRQTRNSKQTFRSLQRVDFSQKLNPDQLEAGTVIRNDIWGGGSGQGTLPGDKTPAYFPGDHGSVNSATLHTAAGFAGGMGPGSCGRHHLNISDSPRSSRLSSFLAKQPQDLDSDNASRCSAEVSNTDSGHGPSEEGDSTHHEGATTSHPRGSVGGATQTRGPSCPVHGATAMSTDTGSARGDTLGAKLPHLRQNPPSAPGRHRPTSLRSHEHGLHGNLPGVHGYGRQPAGNSGSGQQLNDLSGDQPPQRPPKPNHPLTTHYKPPPKDLWINSNKFDLSNTGTGSSSATGARDRLPASVKWPAAQTPTDVTAGSDEDDDDSASSASEGSFVLNLGEIKSVDV